MAMLRHLTPCSRTVSNLRGYSQVAQKVGDRSMKPANVAVILILCVVSGVFSAQSAHADKAVYRAELQAYGFANGEELTQSSLNFLSDTLLLVTINESRTLPTQQFGRSRATIVRSNTDVPPSTFLLFDLSQQRVKRSATIPVQKLKDNVWAVRDSHFLILDSSEVK